MVNYGLRKKGFRMNRLFLHIGMPKTGTTTLQFMLDANRKALEDNSVLYPQTGYTGSLHDRGHHELVRAAKNRNHALYAELRDELDSSAAAVAILSSEEFSLATPSDIGFIKQALEGVDVKIVVYLREQASFVEALYNQAVKTGGEKRERHEFMADMLCAARLNYHAMVNAWAKRFGMENMRVRKYGDQLRIGKTLIDDFCGCVGVDTNWLQIHKGDYNIGVDNKYIEFLRAVNISGVEVGFKNNRIVSGLLRHQRVEGGSGLRIFDAIDRRLIRNFCRASNRALVKDYFPEQAGDLFDADDGVAAVVPAHVPNDVLIEIVQILFAGEDRRN